MAGVGSTNAMKKGSGNNPFLAFSEADMQGYLNSAYTGCIVKYSGDAISRYLSESNKTVAEYAQNLVFNTNISAYPFTSGYVRIKIQKVAETSYITSGSNIDGTWRFEKNTTGYGTPKAVLTSSLETGTTDVKYLTEIINDQGNITEWLYDEDVTFTVEAGDYGQTAGYIDFSKTHDITIVPYKVNELYKVVYGDGEYYFEEYYHISDTRTTADSDYIAVGKTAFDFTGNLQTGNGSKVNPYLANTIDELKAYLTSAYKGAFVKVAKHMADADGTQYYKDSVYQVVDDGTTLTYAVLPELVNEGSAADLAKGKQLINGQGEVVEGMLTDDIDYTQDVMFWDYDGKLLHACTLAEAKAMTELPTVPDHTDKGLVFYKWNYTLDDIKNINHGADIGALYATIDGKTHLFFNIVSDLTKEITLYVIKSYNNQAASLTIDWGDGTDVETYVWDQNTIPSSANFPKHTYATLGQYEVKIEHISDYRNQWLYLGSTTYSISNARNLFGQSLRYASPNAISTVLTKVYVGKRMYISCGNCVNLTEISLYGSPVAPCGLKYTQVKHVNTSNSIGLNAFNYSAIETFSCSATSIEAAFCLSYCAIKRIACKAYTQTYSDATALTLPSLRTCIWPRYSSYRLQLDISACKKVALDAIAQYDNTASSPSLYLVAATKLYMQRFYTYGNNTTINAGIISAPLLQQFIIDNATPIALTAAFTKIPATCQYYVPDEAVDAYKTTAGWSDMADRIHPISELAA